MQSGDLKITDVRSLKRSTRTINTDRQVPMQFLPFVYISNEISYFYHYIVFELHKPYAPLQLK